MTNTYYELILLVYFALGYMRWTSIDYNFHIVMSRDIHRTCLLRHVKDPQNMNQRNKHVNCQETNIEHNPQSEQSEESPSSSRIKHVRKTGCPSKNIILMDVSF